MSLRVLLILEDARNNGYLLEPLLKAILSDINKPYAKIGKLMKPTQPQGFDSATRLIRDPQTLLANGPEFPLWVFMPDADRGIPQVLEGLERDLACAGQRLLTCALKPEAEICALIGRERELGLSWKELRQHPRLKEEVFERHLRSLRDRSPGAGRTQLIQAVLKNLKLVYRRCDELQSLKQRLQQTIAEIEGKAT